MLHLPKRSILLFAAFAVYWLVASIFVIQVRDIWLDEGFTFLFLNSEADVFQGLILGNEMNMAPYYLLLRPFALLGIDTVELRYFSLLPAFATIVLLFWFCRRQFSEGLALFASFILIANPLFIRYSGELRAYSFVMLLCLLGFVFLYHFLKSRRPIYLYALSGVAILSFYSAFLSLIYFGMIGAVLLIDCVVRRGDQFKLLIISFSICFIALLPGFYVIMVSGGENLDWIEPFSVRGAYRMLYQLLGSAHTGNLWVERSAVVCFILACVWILYSWLQSSLNEITPLNNNHWRAVFFRDSMPFASKASTAVLVGIGTLVLGFGISLVQSIMVLRYFTMVIPVLTLVLAIGLWSIPHRVVRHVVVVFSLVVFSYQSASLFDEAVLKNQSDDWPIVTENLSHLPCSEDIGVVLLSPFEQVRFNAHILNEERKSGDLACLNNIRPNWFSFETGGLIPGVDVQKDIRSTKTVNWSSISEQYDSLWVIAVNRAASDNQFLLSEIEATLNTEAERDRFELRERLRLQNTTMLLWKRGGQR